MFLYLSLENGTTLVKAHLLNLSLTSVPGKIEIRHPSPANQSPFCVRASFPLTHNVLPPRLQAVLCDKVAGTRMHSPFFLNCPSLTGVYQEVWSYRSKEHLLLWEPVTHELLLKVLEQEEVGVPVI